MCDLMPNWKITTTGYDVGIQKILTPFHKMPYSKNKAFRSFGFYLLLTFFNAISH